MMTEKFFALKQQNKNQTNMQITPFYIIIIYIDYFKINFVYKFHLIESYGTVAAQDKLCICADQRVQIFS